MNNFMAVLKRCEKCGEEYMPAHQDSECPHTRLVDKTCKNCGGDIDALQEVFNGTWTTCEEIEDAVQQRTSSENDRQSS